MPLGSVSALSERKDICLASISDVKLVLKSYETADAALGASQFSAWRVLDARIRDLDPFSKKKQKAAVAAVPSFVSTTPVR